MYMTSIGLAQERNRMGIDVYTIKRCTSQNVMGESHWNLNVDIKLNCKTKRKGIEWSRNRDEMNEKDQQCYHRTKVMERC